MIEREVDVFTSTNEIEFIKRKIFLFHHLNMIHLKLAH